MEMYNIGVYSKLTSQKMYRVPKIDLQDSQQHAIYNMIVPR